MHAGASVVSRDSMYSGYDVETRREEAKLETSSQAYVDVELDVCYGTMWLSE